MIPRQDISFRKLLLWCLIAACVLISAYLCFISLFFIWIGVEHINRSGFWLPIILGLLFLFLVLYAAVRLIKHTLKKMQGDDVVHI
jgi:hypothetical protein